MIREVETKDYNKILDIYNYYIKNTTITFEEKILSYEDMSKRIDEIKECFPYIVYEENNEVLGYAYLNYFSKRSAYRYSSDLSIYLKAGEGSKGIGTKLYKEIEKIAHNRGFKKIISCISKDNIKSINFHKKMGFNTIGEIKNAGFKFGSWLTIVWMDKNI